MKTNASVYRQAINVLVLSLGVATTVCLSEQPNATVVELLSGPSRVGAPRSGLDTAISNVPETLAIRLDNGEIVVENNASVSGDSIVFSRVLKNEKLAIGNAAPQLVGASRSAGSTASANTLVSSPQQTSGLDQLLGTAQVRGASLISPSSNTRLLSGNVTFRRKSDDSKQLEAQEVKLLQGNTVLAKFSFSPGITTLKWSDIHDLPKDIRSGLKSGEYMVRVANANVVFQVEEEEEADWVWEPIAEMEQLAGASSDTYRAFAVEYLASLDYVSDALDFLELAESTPYVKSTRLRLIGHLQGDQASKRMAPTGIREVDQIRQLIDSSRWNEARIEIGRLLECDDDRTRGLAKLYAAVIAGQGSQCVVYSSDPVVELFESATRSLVDNAADEFRAQSNFGSYLLSKSQSRIYNHAVQAATNLKHPFSTALWLWSQAQQKFKNAELVSVKLSKSDRAATAMSQARLYSTMGDFLRSLGAPDDVVEKLISTADAQAGQYASTVTKLAEDPNVRAAAFEVLAHLAYRKGDWDEVAVNNQKALQAFECSGAISGLAGCHRTQGLINEQLGNIQQAITNYETSLRLSELLRSRVTESDSGSNRAGFFARHVYTNERLVELLIRHGDAVRALEVAETAKARSFEDVLKSNSAGDAAEDELPIVAEILEFWPAETCAIEYFIGSRRAFVFCILPGGRVTAHIIQTPDGKEMPAAELVADTASFVSSMEFQARKLYQQAIGGRGFDKTWHDKLHQYYLLLIPEVVRAKLHEFDRVVIVPHHVLHYFPFAGLVTKPDLEERGLFEFPQPTFLVEETNSIIVAPSLVSHAYLSQAHSVVDTAHAVGLADFPNAPSLPGVKKDMENFREVFGELIGDMVEANSIPETAVRETLSKPGLLLIGTHGHNEADNPLSSFLLCSPKGESDGHLTAEEIFNTNVGSELVLLSACYSGLADRSPLPGDDLFGINRALLHSGANSVVAGLWDVYDDVAPVLVHNTFKHLRSGKPIAESLRNAQCEFISQRKKKGSKDPWIHPYFWAVYTCTGGGMTSLANAQ